MVYELDHMGGSLIIPGAFFSNMRAQNNGVIPAWMSPGQQGLRQALGDQGNLMRDGKMVMVMTRFIPRPPMCCRLHFKVFFFQYQFEHQEIS